MHLDHFQGLDIFMTIQSVKQSIITKDDPKFIAFKDDYDRMMNGQTKPSSIVGRGYKNPKQVASQWLMREMYNVLNVCNKVSQIHVASSGKGFSSESRAMQSKTYQSLVNGEYKLLNGCIVSGYGVLPTPLDNGSFMIYVEYQRA